LNSFAANIFEETAAQMMTNTDNATVAATKMDSPTVGPDSAIEPQAGEKSAQTPPKESTEKSQKRKNHRAGISQRAKKINSLFLHEHRRKCKVCSEMPSAWNCLNCGRTLPRGKWSELGLAGEDETASFFGRLRLLTQAGKFSKQNELILYKLAKDLLTAFEVGGVLVTITNPAVELEPGPFPKTKWQPVERGWTFAEDKIAAEDREDSIMGVFRKAIEHGHMKAENADEWIWLARSIAKSWTKVAARIANDLHMPQVAVTKDEDSEEFADFTDRKKTDAIFLDPENITGLDFKEMRKILAETDPPVIQTKESEGKGQHRELKSVKVYLEKVPPLHGSDETERTKPAEGQATKSDLINVVEAQKERAQAEEARKQQIQDARQAKKDQSKAKKARAKEEVDKIRRRAAQHRKQKRLVKEAKRNQLEGNSYAEQSSMTDPLGDGSLEDDLVPITSESPNPSPEAAGSAENETGIVVPAPLSEAVSNSPARTDPTESDLGSDDEVIVFKPRGKRLDM